jgi:hypothetical protein
VIAFNKITQPSVGADYAHERIDPGIRMGDIAVMLSAAKHLSTERDRPFAALRACPERSEGGDSGGADFIIRSIF